MAGRPVAARGGNGMLYGMIAFVIVSVAALGAFIWQLTVNQRLVEEATRARARQAELGSPLPYYEQEARARGTSVLATMNDQFEKLAVLLVGKNDAVPPAIAEQAQGLLKKIASDTPETVSANDTVITALVRVHDAHLDAQRKVKTLEDELKTLTADKQALAEGLQTTREAFEQQVAELKGEVERMQTETAEQLAAKDAQLAEHLATNNSLTEEFNRFKATTRANQDQSDITTTRLKSQVSSLNEMIQDLKQGGFKAEDILTKADAKVVRAIPGSDVVYIDLGENSRIKPGLSFEVYSQDGERGEDFRGKASIEVTHIGENAAECRVTRSTPGRPIVEGDVVVNIAYEQNREPKFVIRGEFDLDYDGTIDPDGVENVTAIIRGWGGQVVPELDETTDYVVIGKGPTVPALTGDRPVSTSVRDLAATQAREWEAFRDVIERAKSLYVPVINQNQFLYLTGYAGGGPMTARSR